MSPPSVPRRRTILDQLFPQRLSFLQWPVSVESPTTQHFFPKTTRLKGLFFRTVSPSPLLNTLLRNQPDDQSKLHSYIKDSLPLFYFLELSLPPPPPCNIYSGKIVESFFFDLGFLLDRLFPRESCCTPTDERFHASYFTGLQIPTPPFFKTVLVDAPSPFLRGFTSPI